MKERSLASFPFILCPPLVLCTQQEGCVCVCCLCCFWSIHWAICPSFTFRSTFLYIRYVLSACGLWSGSPRSWVISWENWRRHRPMGLRLGCGRGCCKVGIFGIPFQLSEYCWADRVRMSGHASVTVNLAYRLVRRSRWKGLKCTWSKALNMHLCLFVNTGGLFHSVIVHSLSLVVSHLPYQCSDKLQPLLTTLKLYIFSLTLKVG